MNRTPTILLVAAALTALAACGNDRKAATDTAAEGATPTAASTPVSNGGAAAVNVAGLGGKAVQLTGDPCALLTVPEIEVALGSGVEQGGFGQDLPGRCTYSVAGDVGAGVVQIILEDPLECNAVLKALASNSLAGSNAVRVEIGDGGLYAKDSDVVFTTGGGCVGVGGSKAGVNLGQEMLVSLATKVAERVG
ncbi:MAG: hypothetical protein QOE00_2652 [Ilumatobacteraceae bacterium]|jgi:hypothetical protein